MTRKERELKENERRCLIAEMTAPVESIADFKVIKNIEMFMTTLTAEQKQGLPYDPDNLHTARELVRERIRELEEELESAEEELEEEA